MDILTKKVMFLRVSIMVIAVMTCIDVLNGQSVHRRSAYYYEGYQPYGESYHITEWYSQPPPPPLPPPPPPPPPHLLLPLPPLLPLPFAWFSWGVKIILIFVLIIKSLSTTRATDLNAEDDICFLYLFDRPGEPLVVPKGEHRVVFDLPEEYMPEQYRPLAENLTNRFGGDDRIVVQPIAQLPDFSRPLQLGRREPFSLFIPRHRRLAAELINIFTETCKTREDLLSASSFCRDRMNPYLFNYALSVALLHRSDTRNVVLPSLIELFPEKYIDSALFAQAREEATIIPVDSRMPLEIPRDYTASDLEDEHRVAYWREDPGINLHHWHWHLVYPFDADRNIVAKDRRGELFYYMHKQIMARYNFERFSNCLARVKPFHNWHEPIKEGYFPKLDTLVASRVWPPRMACTKIKDINRPADQLNYDILDLERWRDRIYEAIHSGRVTDSEGRDILLTESLGIDILGNIVEASILSVNRNLYGDVHNLGHLAIAFAHDPDGRHLESFGVMGDSATAMRDPVFYRWHAFTDDVFQEHKALLPRYTVDQLSFTGIQITSLSVNADGQPTNLLATFWQQSDVDMSRGLDFTPRGSVLIRFTHLQHSPFTYNIEVENSGEERQGTVRIFLAPTFDERGIPFLFTDQKHLFIELDKFVVTLQPGTTTNIIRHSTESSVTIPYEMTFRNLDENRPESGPGLEAFNYCGCGWPQHVLIPKGTAEGLPCQLFVMISNYEDDEVAQNMTDTTCSNAASYCGIRDNLYPDKRSMGFPFDRQPRDGVNTLQQFLTPNMAVQDVTIRFTNRIVPRE